MFESSLLEVDGSREAKSWISTLCSLRFSSPSPPSVWVWWEGLSRFSTVRPRDSSDISCIRTVACAAWLDGEA